MNRQTFVATGAGALLAGCAGTSLVPNSASPSAQPLDKPKPAEASNELLGSIVLIPYDFVPENFMSCDGQKIPIASNPGLYSLLENRFGGDGSNDFALPDLRGHEPIKGLSYAIVTRGIYPERKPAAQPNYYYDGNMGQLAALPYAPQYLPSRFWAKCDGQLINISSNVALFALIGNKFGGNSRTTFALPDLRKHEILTGITYVIFTTGRFPSAR